MSRAIGSVTDFMLPRTRFLACRRHSTKSGRMPRLVFNIFTHCLAHNTDPPDARDFNTFKRIAALCISRGVLMAAITSFSSSFSQNSSPSS
uniref:Uncharacterized protein n=1 Tax=Spodoptera frugiperda ascovirus 1a TaxID=113370 RepID=Q9DKM0_SFAVA|nr:hypothetical protein [Spodoptera frugiperda ascovirus 1a]